MKTRGFTLAESLVSFGVAAILAALLFPLCSSAWQVAQMTQCKCNLYRIYQAQAQWRADNNSALLTGTRWMRYLWPYVEGDETVFHCATRGAWGYSREAMEEWAANKGQGGDEYWDSDSSPWERNMSGNPFSPSGNDPDAIFEFYVYLQKGSSWPDAGQGSGSHERGDFAYSIPLGSHPWIDRIDHGSYTNYRVDDTATGISSHDDLELNIHHNEEGDPTKVDIIQASGWNTWSVTRRFIIDFHICGERVVKDWCGQENPDRKNHYGETIIIEYEEDQLDPTSPGSGSGNASKGGWVRPGAAGRGFHWDPATMTFTITGGLSRYYGDYAINLGTYSRRDGTTVTGVDGKLFYVLDYGGWDLVANYTTGSRDRWDKYFISSLRGQTDAIKNWQAAFPGEGDWRSWQALRHFGKANVLFCDGHIESLGPVELEESGPGWTYSGGGSWVGSPPTAAVDSRLTDTPALDTGDSPDTGDRPDTGGRLDAPNAAAPGGTGGLPGSGAPSGVAGNDPEFDPIKGRWVDGEPGASVQVTLYWNCLGNADVYLNGKPLRRYKADFRTRPAGPVREFSAPAVLHRGDVITIGARRRQPSGILLVAVDCNKRVVWKTDEATWKAYFPADETLWWLPEVAKRSASAPVTAQPYLWPVQARLNRRFDDAAQSIWHEEAPLVFLVSVIE